MARSSTGSVVEDHRGDEIRHGLRCRANGKRHYVSLGAVTRAQAEQELHNVLADVRRGIWQPLASEPAVETVVEKPTVHVLASEWVERRRHEVDARSVEHWKWALSAHLLPFFADYRPSQITAAVIDKYKTVKLAEREQRLAAIERWQAQDPATRGRMPVRPLNNGSINKTLKTLAQVLDDAVEFGYLDTNPDRVKRLRLKA
jgi:hypothetical protein